MGQAFYRGDICLFSNRRMKVANGWSIKEDVPFESISFGRIIEKKGDRRIRLCLTGFVLPASSAAGNSTIKEFWPFRASCVGQ